MFKSRGVFFATDREGKVCGIRCACSMKFLSTNWDKNRFQRHFETTKHVKWEAKKDTDGTRQATVDMVNADKLAAQGHQGHKFC